MNALHGHRIDPIPAIVFFAALFHFRDHNLVILNIFCRRFLRPREQAKIN
jgi:hypothetical protein